MERDNDPTSLELSLDQMRQPAELEEAKIELEVNDVGIRQAKRLLESSQLRVPTIVPVSDDPELSGRVDDLRIGVREDVDRHLRLCTIDDVAGVLGNAAPRVPGRDHRHARLLGGVLDVAQEVVPASCSSLPSEFCGDEISPASGLLGHPLSVDALDVSS